MQKLKHVTLTIAMLCALMVPANASAQSTIQVDQLYCDSLALMAKAGAEAKQRGESLTTWRQNLTAMQSTTALSRDNVLFSVLPQVIKDAKGVYADRKTPIDTYLASYKTCMTTELGSYIAMR